MLGVQAIEQEAKSILNQVKGMGFAWSINPYRGCYHQCRFCFARKSHRYLEEDGVDDWGRRIYVKINAPAVLRAELAKRSWRHEYVVIGTSTDPYQPFEGTYRLTRGILQALADYETPAGLITRSPLVVRDIDVLTRLAHVAGASVSISIATLDESLAREIEPTVAPPRQRLRAVQRLAEAGIKTNVALAPVIPSLTDSEENIAAVVSAAREAGASHIWHNTLYLHEITRDTFFSYLREYRPELVAEYAALYQTKYVSRDVQQAIVQRVDRALKTARPRNVPHIEAHPAVQLSLL